MFTRRGECFYETLFEYKYKGSLNFTTGLKYQQVMNNTIDDTYNTISVLIV